ncbi:hypothetical protein [Aeromicrobium sp.]|uniref:hypothetical protein n=1 Tax=Aeromicrobium sp. TaxID=1871063 RepID=UPI00199C3E2F|nr:hypothetical protein [Aeromicrobium sp.]MBC7630546.1 hypothetical protein [Aeromicrobium sp.]
MSDTKEPRDTRLVASAALLGLIVVAGIIVVVLRLSGGGGDAGAGGNPEPSATQSADSSSVCGLPDSDQAVPSAAAPEATWELNGKMAQPRSPKYGPGSLAGGVGSCFAHSPTGALFAAATYLVDASNPSTSDASLRSRFTEGSPEINDPDDGSVAPTYQIAGYRFDDVTADRATVAVAVRVTEGPAAGGQVALTFTMMWEKDDWRIVVPVDGELPSAGITSLAGFVPWAGA